MSTAGKRGFALARVHFTALFRRPAASGLLILTAMLAACLAVVLCQMTDKQQQAILQMERDTRIRGVVTNARGQTDNIHVLNVAAEMLLGRRRMRGCYLDDYVQDVQAIGAEELELPAETSLVRMTCLAADSSLLGSRVDFYPGWDESVLLGNERVCLLPRELLPLVVSDPDGTEWLPVTRSSGQTAQIRVIGVVEGTDGASIYGPIGLQLQDGITETFWLDRCEFVLRDNTRLDEARRALFEYFTAPDLTAQQDFFTMALILQDETYLKTMQELQSNLSLLRLLLPVLTVLMGCIGFFAGFLAVRGRKKEFAVMRCLGLSPARLLGLLAGEQAVLALLGGAAGVGAGVWIQGALPGPVLAGAASMVAVFLAGAVLACWRISRVNVMLLMKEE